MIQAVVSFLSGWEKPWREVWECQLSTFRKKQVNQKQVNRKEAGAKDSMGENKSTEGWSVPRSLSFTGLN